ncbi:caspase family protein [Tropicimonas sp. S265A]|uniref:caspase family protein n=1 Tax=Tropicimonas sp. S265A TaxID=3415134 RepID=UPI003C7DC5CA
MYRFWCFLLAIAVVFVSSAADAQTRRALIIGNDTYLEIQSLEKARSDAAGYAELFRRKGFEVTHVEDRDARGMRRSLSAFYDTIMAGDIVAFVYAGHGWSDGRENYLIPTDVPAYASPTLIAAESFPLRNGVNGVVDEIKSRGASLAIAIIDACRNNPFKHEDGSRSVGMERGLALVKAPRGTFIAFSAGAGQTALDRLSENDTSPYSVFSRHFIDELGKDQDIQTAFKTTQRAVNQLAQSVGHGQRPAYYDEVLGRVCLAGPCPDQIEQPTPAVAQPMTEIAFWEAIQNTNDPNELRAYLETFPQGSFRRLAEVRLAALTPPAEVVPAPVPQPAPEPETEVAALPPVDLPVQRLLDPEPVELSRAEARDLQARLNILGHDAGVEDGLVGARTRAAVLDYRSQNGLGGLDLIDEFLLDSIALAVPEAQVREHRRKAEAAAEARRAAAAAARRAAQPSTPRAPARAPAQAPAAEPARPADNSEGCMISNSNVRTTNPYFCN